MLGNLERKCEFIYLWTHFFSAMQYITSGKPQNEVSDP